MWLHQGRFTVHMTYVLYFSLLFITVRTTEFWIFNLTQHSTRSLICSAVPVLSMQNFSPHGMKSDYCTRGGERMMMTVQMNKEQ